MKRLFAVCVVLALGACRRDDAPDPGAAAIVPAAPVVAAEPAGSVMPPATINHIEGRRSERIIWLMEELGLPYTLEFKRGDLLGSIATIKEVNAAMPVAPTVDLGGQVLVESGAIIEPSSTATRRASSNPTQPTPAIRTT